MQEARLSSVQDNVIDIGPTAYVKRLSDDSLSPRKSLTSRSLRASEEIFEEGIYKKDKSLNETKIGDAGSENAVISPMIGSIKLNKRNFEEKINELKTLLGEEETVITKVSELFSNNSNEYAEDLMEALLYEFRIRSSAEKDIIKELSQSHVEIENSVNKLIEHLKKGEEELAKLKEGEQKKNLMQAGTFKKFASQGASSDESDMYDWQVDIDLLTDICRNGWKVEFSPMFCTFNQEFRAFSQCKKVDPLNDNNSSPDISAISLNNEQVKNKLSNWEGAIVSVVGLYDKGKTFVLNNITNSNLPSGKKVNTKGLSFKHVNVDNGTNLVLLDTAGSYSPVRVVNELSVLEKEATEMFILDMVLELSDYFICVVNDFTSLDQRYLDKLSRNLQTSPNKTFREVIVIHNLKEVGAQEVLDHLWQTQVTQIYGSGSIQKTKVAAVNPETKRLEEKHVVWFKTNYSRHLCLCNDNSTLGSQINPWAFSLLKYWLKTVIVPVNRVFSVIDSVMTQASTKLSSYFKTNIPLTLEETPNTLVKYIQTKTVIADASERIPQMSIDSTGFVMTRPDNFLPHVDIVQGNEYIIYMDVPGLTRQDITISRQNAITIVKGNKKKPADYEEGTIEKNERKYGEFTMTFKIPDIYERKWKGCTVQNGVLKIWFVKDESDFDNVKVSEMDHS